MAPAAKGQGKMETKKRRSSEASTSQNTSTGPQQTAKVSKANMHAELSKMEEEEARNRSSEEDSVLLRNICDDIKKQLRDVLNLRMKKGGAKANDLSELKIKMSLQMLSLKRLNRLDKMRTKWSREETNGTKQNVDAFNLQLQNLLYEVLHLRKEITKCQQYRSQDEEMTLVPIDEFYRSAPEEIAKPDVTSSDAHQQHLARLEFENMQRQQLNKTLKNFEQQKELLEKMISQRRKQLAMLKPQLQTILEATLPVQEYLNLPITEERNQADLARFLPHPLFILFSELQAFQEALDKNMSVKIIGDLDEAKAFYYQAMGFTDLDEEADGNTEDADEEDADKKKKLRSAKKSSSAMASEVKMSNEEIRLWNLVKTHPLRVHVTIRMTECDASVDLIFSHLSKLKAVAVSVKLNVGQDFQDLSPDLEVLRSSALLANLLSTDDGYQSPHKMGTYLLKEAGFTKIPAVAVETVGFLYHWAQTLGGIAISTSLDDDVQDGQLNKIGMDEEVFQTKVQEIISCIRDRVESRLCLQRQLCQLEKAKVTVVEPELPPEVEAEFPQVATNCRLHNWSAVNWEDYAQVEITQHLITANLVDGHDFFYRLQINREPALLIALIAIKPDYPNSRPIFCLNLHWHKEYNLANSERLRALENVINLEKLPEPRKAKRFMLSLQMRRLMSCLDVLLESWSTTLPREHQDFRKEHLFLQAVKGRRRELPLSYDPTLQLFVQHR